VVQGKDACHPVVDRLMSSVAAAIPCAVIGACQWLPVVAWGVSIGWKAGKCAGAVSGSPVLWLQRAQCQLLHLCGSAGIWSLGSAEYCLVAVCAVIGVDVCPYCCAGNCCCNVHNGVSAATLLGP
jgi:hypothetical protein